MSDITSVPHTPNRSARRIRTVLLVSAILIAVTDLAIKALVETLLSRGNVIDLGLMNIRLLYNSGVAFSLGTNLPSWVLIAVTGVMIIGLIWYTVSVAPTITMLSCTGAALLLGGALGNFIDRLGGRGVVDYLHTGWFPTFNLADVFITTGVTLFILGTLLSREAKPVVNHDPSAP